MAELGVSFCLFDPWMVATMMTLKNGYKNF